MTEKDPSDKRDKSRSTDRVLVLKVKDGEKAKSSTGILDTRLFTKDNNLHLVQDLRTTLWFFKYEKGGVPEPLKQKFTDYATAYRFAEQYLDRRNVEIESVID